MAVATSRPVSAASARLPCPGERDIENPVKLADMPERERPQKRSQRRRSHHPVPKHPRGAPAAQHVAVIDAVCAEQHRVNPIS